MVRPLQVRPALVLLVLLASPGRLTFAQTPPTELLALRKLRTGTPEERERAARKLGLLKSRKAVPLIVEQGVNGGISEDVAREALGLMGKRAVPALADVLTDARRDRHRRREDG
jgi:hypothetical protein